MATSAMASSSVRPSSFRSTYDPHLMSSAQASTTTPAPSNPTSRAKIGLEWDNEDSIDDIEEPDFFFKYDKDPPAAIQSSAAGPSSHKPSTRPQNSSFMQPTAIERLSNHQRAYSQTPPSVSAKAGLDSNPSSGSSSHVMSSSSSISSSQFATTITSPAERMHGEPGGVSRLRSASNAEEGPGSGGSGRMARMYGSGQRTFQRVVSAPIARSGLASEREASGSSSRPALTHTNSTSSIPEERTQTQTQNMTTNKTVATPGYTSRNYPMGSTSTARRLGGLSRFGGPARRVVQQPEEEKEDEPGKSRESTPALTGELRTSAAHRPSESPREPSPRYSPEPLAYTKPDIKPVAEPLVFSRPESRTQRRVSPPPSRSTHVPVIEEERSTTIRPERLPRHTKDEAFEHEQPPEEAWRRARPMPTADQENPLESRRRSREREIQPRAYVEPLRPSQTILNTTSSDIHRRHELPAPAPPLPKLDPPPRANLDVPAPPERRPSPGFAMHAPTAPANPAIAQQTQQAPTLLNSSKRSYVVNGAPYERVGVLGKGGSSKVYSVICPTKRIIYALKRVSLERADAETYQSYTNEIELLTRLRGHDRVISLIDYQISFGQGNRPKVLMMVMECGEIDFAMLLDEQRGKPLNMNFVGLYWQQMLEAVQAVHQENVVHTDLKPANFVLVKGRLKIIDFGIAKAIANDTVNIQRDNQIGTVNYMSPEAIQRMNNQKVLKLSYPSDVWSLGCILYQMIYTNPPFAHLTGGPLHKMNAIADPTHQINYPSQSIPKASIGRDGQPNDPTQLAVRVSPAAIDTMKRCLAYKKEERLKIEELLQHEFLHPTLSSVPPGATTITVEQMSRLVNFVKQMHNQPLLAEHDTTAVDLFEQLMEQNIAS